MKQYRIIRHEKREPNNYHQLFTVEQRYFLFFWRPIVDSKFHHIAKTFNTIHSAEVFIKSLKTVSSLYNRKIEKYI